MDLRNTLWRIDDLLFRINETIYLSDTGFRNPGIVIKIKECYKMTKAIRVGRRYLFEVHKWREK